MWVLPIASALATNVGDVEGEAEASLTRTQYECAPGPFVEDEDTVRGVTGRPERGERLWSGH